MKVLINYQGESADLYLEPECDRDRVVLDRLEERFGWGLVGFGRHPETGEAMHARVPLPEE